jgi:asparagine synthase (glutamine-hydrolysing)
MIALQTYFDVSSRREIYCDAWRGNLNGNLNGGATEFKHRFPGIAAADAGLVEFMTRDFETGMIDDGLVKVDRASMACSLEVRSPFLDHHVIEFAMRIPPQFKLKHGRQKIVLKEAFKDLLPQTIASRGKQGFELPFGQWFQKKVWRDLLLDMLGSDRLRRQGIFDSNAIVQLRDQFLNDPEAHKVPLSAYQLRHRVWGLLMFQMWHEQFIN